MSHLGPKERLTDATKQACVTECMHSHGYRPVMEADLTLGLELTMVYVRQYVYSQLGVHPSHAESCSTVVVECPENYSPHTENYEGSVFFRRTNPFRGGQSRVRLEEVLRIANTETRFFVKEKK